MSGLLLLAILCLLAYDKTSLETASPAPGRPPAPPPWPQVVPDGLPPFPGAGWVPDEPPPVAVVTRAYQLLSELWAQGENSFRIEKVQERWIVFRAEMVKGGKKGVVAYRLKSQTAAQSSIPSSSVPTSSDTSPPWGVPAESRTPPAQQVRTIQQGSTGSDVVLAQQKLGVSPADGIFGPATRAAVIAFQKRQGIAQDGIVGTLTWAALLAEPSAAPAATPTPLALPSSTTPAPVRTIKQGSTGSDVVLAQQKLGVSPADGKFGPATKARVVAFQKSRGLEADGIVGPATWKALLG